MNTPVLYALVGDSRVLYIIHGYPDGSLFDCPCAAWFPFLVFITSVLSARPTAPVIILESFLVLRVRHHLCNRSVAFFPHSSSISSSGRRSLPIIHHSLHQFQLVHELALLTISRGHVVVVVIYLEGMWSLIMKDQSFSFHNS